MKHTPQHGPEDLSLAVAGERAEALAWVAGMVRNGLSQVYAVELAECFEPKHHGRLVERFRQANLDSAQIGQLEATLHAWEQADPAARSGIVERLAPVVFEGVDHILEQAQAAGRDRTGVHLAAARFGHEVVILADPDPHQAWLLPATQTRLREALAEIGFYPTVAETQQLDMQQGDVLQLLGFEFRCARDRRGAWEVHLQRAPALTASRPAEAAVEAPVEPAQTATPQTRPHRAPAEKKPPAPEPEEPPDAGPEELADDAGPDVQRAQPLQWLLGLWPFGASPRHHDVRGLTDPSELVPASLRRAAGLEVSWRHLPITLYPVLGFTVGWTSPLSWVCLALLVVCNLQSLPAILGFAGRHPLAVAVAACCITSLALLWPKLSAFYARMSREAPAPKMPPGFYLGQYNVSWDAELVQYGLYVPPHFQHEQGPFPLIVVLHYGGVAQGTKEGVFSQGVPYAIVHDFGERSKNGRFDFAVFLPLNRSGGWGPENKKVGDILKALSYVMRRHRIDPARVYLTGVYYGADGIWRWAEAYPDRWAGVVPVAGINSPDVQKVRHIPAWIFHGMHAQRDLAQQLKEAGTEVRYTEFENFQHVLWHVYDRKELYDWLKQQVRR